MANHTPFMALILLVSLLLCATGQANEPAPKSSIGKAEQIALDSIAITIAEATRAKAFLDSIPKLASLGNVISKPKNKDVQYLGGLSNAIKKVQIELQKVEDSLPNYNTKSLEDIVNGVLSFNVVMDHALEDVDGTIKHMVLRKIEDIVLLTNDVIFHVALLQ